MVSFRLSNASVLALCLLLACFEGQVQPIRATGEEVRAGDVVIIPKYEQINFEQNILGAAMAQEESGAVQNGDVGSLVPLFPIRERSREDQLEMVRDAALNGASAIMISNNAGTDLDEETLKAHEAGTTMVSFDSPIKGAAAAGEDLFISPVDFDETGRVMAEMTLNILGNDGGDFAILSTNPHAANQNAWIANMQKTLKSNPKRYSKLNLIGIYFPVVDGAEGYVLRTLDLVAAKQNGTYPNLGLIMAPTTSGSAAAAKTLLEHGLCDEMKISGLSIPAEVLEAAENGCSPEFAFWNNVDVGYLAYYATHALVTGKVKGEVGDVVEAGRLGPKTIEVDPTRENARRVILGEFTKYNSENVERAAFIDCIMGFCGPTEEYFEKRFMMKYKKKALAIIPKITGMISFLCSAFLVQHILRCAERRKSPFQRLVLGMSVSDMASSFFGFFLSTWPMPSGTWLAYGAVGLPETCEAQGFLFQVGISATPLYNSALATFYLMKIVYGWDEKRIAVYEPLFHIFPIGIGLGTAIAGISLELYNPSSRGYMCWIDEYPPYCSNSLSCERGENAVKYRWAFLYGFVCVTLVWLAAVMFAVFYKVLKQERTTDKYRRDRPTDNSHRKHSRKVANQALFYVLAFAFPWIWGLLLSFMDTRNNIFTSSSIDDAITGLQLANAIIFPLQGLFNGLVYVRPRYYRIRRKYPNLTFVEIIAKVLSPNFTATTTIASGTLRRTSRLRTSFALRKRMAASSSAFESNTDRDGGGGGTMTVFQLENQKQSVLNEDDNNYTTQE